MTSEDHTTRTVLPLRVYLWVGLVAVAIRLVYLTEHAASPFFGFPILDEVYYETVARQLAAGESVTGINPGFRPLLYPWLLSLLYRVAGDWGHLLAVLAQHALGIGTVLLVTSLGHRLSGRTDVASVAGLLFALAGPPLFFEGELLVTTLITFLCTFLLLRLVAVPLATAEWGEWRLWAAAGALLGLAAQARPNVLVVALLFPAAVVARRRAGWRRGLALSAIALVSLCAVLVLFAALQRPHFGSFQLTTGSGGINLYLGNKRGADGMIPRQDRAVTYGAVYRDSVEVFAREEYVRASGRSDPTPAQISRYWLGRAGAEITADPGAWLRLMLRKTWLLLWHYEIPNNKSYDFVAREESALLAVLPVRWWILVALAPLGAGVLLRQGNRERIFWLLGFIFLWGAGLALFFVNSRFRIPLWPAACVLAASALVWLAQTVRARRLPHAALGAAVVAAAAAVSLVDWPDVGRSDPSRDYFYRSLAHLERGDVEAAAADAHRATEIDPSEAVYVYQAGAVDLRAGRFAAAAAAFRAAGRLKPEEPRIWNDLGVALEAQGDYRRAYANYRKATRQAADFPPALTNAALLEVRAGDLQKASAHLQRAAAAGDDSVAFLCARALLLQARGETAQSQPLLAAARERDPRQTDRLMAEGRIPVELFPMSPNGIEP